MTENANPVHSQPRSAVSAFRRSPRFGALSRLLLGIGGATLVLFPVASGNSYIFSVIGLVMFIAATMLLPARPRSTFDDKARELGALLVVDGGRYQLSNSPSVPVQLFVFANRISALDARFRQVLEIPTTEITSFLALQDESGWFLEVIWSDSAAEFSYRGASAERLAHVAENAIRRVAPASAPPAPQRRAAGV